MKRHNTREVQLRDLFDQVWKCRQCSGVQPCLVPRIPEGCASSIALMAQAPSSSGVRKTGRQWCGNDGKLRRGGIFLDKYLRTIGYSVDPESQGFHRPYTTNAIHCWPGASPKGRDRVPRKSERDACRCWWQKELSIVQPKILVLLGESPSIAISEAAGLNLSFRDFRKQSLVECHFNGLTIRCIALPHPTAPFREQSAPHQTIGELYSAAFAAIKKELAKQH